MENKVLDNIWWTVKLIMKFAILTGIVLIGLFANKFYLEYRAEKTIVSEYLISSNKINKVSVVGLSIKPTKVSVETEDGLYSMVSDNRFKSMKTVNTLQGEDFTTRKFIVDNLKKKKVNNVKKGSLTYKGKGIYEAYDFDTKHTYTITYDEDKNDISAEYKEID